ncbi:aspartic proteinase CDR1-like [Gossypium australe]|uniref:Aspartic proteinase CDR1-like n=1 Tax=Gossypium australe TaxID=47621 RepID=A0A5B6WI70_9ROSI|nr:aspartic proteinase CDR1-like [Gossypium australe]
MSRDISALEEYSFDLEIERTLRIRRKELQEMKRIRNDQPLHQNGKDADIPRIIDDRDRPTREHELPILDELKLGIVKPHIQAQHFELKPVMFQMLQTIGQFSGLPTEDPRLHLRLFLEVCDSFRCPEIEVISLFIMRSCQSMVKCITIRCSGILECTLLEASAKI